MKKTNRALSLLLALCMVLGLFSGTASAAEATETAQGGDRQLVSPLAQRNEALEENSPEQASNGLSVSGREIEKPSDLEDLTGQQAMQPRQELYEPQEVVRAIVVLEDRCLLEQGYSTASIASQTPQVTLSRAAMESRQATVLSQMRLVAPELDVRYHYTVAVNGMAVEMPYEALEQVEALSGVKAVFVVPRYDVPQDMTDPATVQPLMYATSTAVGAVQTWDAGYTGEGMRIAVIDTGLDLDHPSFTGAPQSPSLTTEELAQVLPSLNASRLYRGLAAERAYRSEKVPFAFNYVDRTLDVTHDNDNQGDHGTHVAGIAAANRLDTTDVAGVAPDAQLLIMKVFGVNGGAYFDDILAALEDSFVLNADVVNMSLGTPAGFSSLSPYIDEIFERILNSDMVVAVAAGNSASAADMNGYGTNRNLTSDPDNGIISSPSTYVGSTAVASVENVSVRFNYVELENGTKVPYNDVAAIALTNLYWTDPNHRAEFVMIPGAGNPEDFEGRGPSTDENGNKRFTSIAVISRGEIDFTTKQLNAKDAGFDACFVYDNVEEDFLNMADSGEIPNAFLTKAGGEAMMAAAGEEGRGMLYLKDVDETETVESSVAGQMSGFSSWGVSPDLQLNPEITAPGGNIYSTLTNGHYGTMSGTSMASPHVAGMSALVLQYLHQNYGALTDSEMHTIAEALLMSTAVPVLERENVPYSPRKQGAGSANVCNAVTSPVYLTAENGKELTPKVSFGDDDGKQGVYRFSFRLNNLTDTPQCYTLDGQALTDQFQVIDGLKFMSETSRLLDAGFTFSLMETPLSLAYDYNESGATDMEDVQALLDAVNGLDSVKAGYDLNGDGLTDTADAQILYELVLAGFETVSQVEVPANGTVTVYVTLTLEDDDKAYMDENYPNGIYVDGFVRCYALTEGAVDLSLPFLGFYGDWSQSPVFDSAWYYEEDPLPNRYMNILFTDYGASYYNLGLNPYLREDYDPAHNVLSPNGDGYQDKISEIYLGMMRNAKLLNFTWLDEAGNPLFNAPYHYAMKNYYMAIYNLVPPLIYSEVCEAYDFRNPDGSLAVEELERVKLQITAQLDDGDDTVDDIIETEVIIDTQAPVLDLDSLDYFYSEKTDSRLLRFTVSDNYDIAAVIPVTPAGVGYEYIPVTTKQPGVDGETATITLDVSDYDATFRIAVCDYGCNESYYEISFEGEKNYNEDAFYAYRLFSAVPVEGNIYLTEVYNGWHSFESAEHLLMHTSMADQQETAVYAAEYVDGYIIGVDAKGDIFTIKAGDWTRTTLGKLATVERVDYGDFVWENVVEYPALDMAFDYTTDTMYVLTDESLMAGPGSGGHLLTVDWLTGEVTDVGRVTGVGEGGQGLTLACDNEGVLYTVDAATGDLYTLDKTTATATFVGETGFVPLYQQTMAVDHETDRLYWAAYQGYEGQNRFLELDKTSGKILASTDMEYNSQLAALYKPYDAPGKNLVPDDAQVTGLTLLPGKLTMKAGDTARVRCAAQPYYAGLNPAELTWSSDNEAVATVRDGKITATGAGTATVTVSYGALTATCQVDVIALEGELYVYDFGTDDSTTNSWLSVDVNAPKDASPVPGAMSSRDGITAAAYVGDKVYAFDSAGAFYELDAATMKGKALKPADNKTAVTAMAFNYTDGFLYALLFDGTESFDLCRVNPHTGELRSVMSGLQWSYNTPLGGMAIDYEGRFYLLGVDYSDNVRLNTFRLEDLGGYFWGADSTYTDLPGLTCGSFGSMVYSDANNGLFWADELGQLYWLGMELGMDEYGGATMEVSTVLLGQMGSTASAGTGMAMNMGLLERVANEPQLPQVDIGDASAPESLTVAVGGQCQANVNVEPWNATYTVRYTMENPAIATVDDSGVITGVSKGVTTLTAAVYRADGSVFGTFTIQVKSVISNVDVYCFMFTDGMAGGLKWLRVNGANPSDMTVEAGYETSFYAAAYYNGSIYTVGPGPAEDGYKNHLMRLDPDTFTILETLPAQIPYNIRDMAFDYTTGTMYGVASGGDSVGSLCQLDLTTGAVTLLPDTGREMATLCCDDEGRLYTITADGMLCEIDKYTSVFREIKRVSGVRAGYQSMHYDYITGNTYWGSDGLYLVDLETGDVNSLGYVGGTYMLIGCVLTRPDVKTEPKAPETTPVTGVSLARRAAVVKGETTQLNATVLPVSVSQVDKTVTWSSDNPAVATVDENGNVTGVSEGTAVITVKAGQYEARCQVTVLAEARKFFAYDETALSWVQIDTETGETTTVCQETGKSPITAAAYTGETLYGFDRDGYFYEIDPETFQRTKLGEGVHGITREVEFGYNVFYTVDVEITDLSWDPDTGRLLGLMNGMYEDDQGVYAIYSALVEVNLEEGRMNPFSGETVPVGGCINITVFDKDRPGNLLVQDGNAYFVDTWFSGILCRMSLIWDDFMGYFAGDSAQIAHVSQLEWGMYFSSRGFVYDWAYDLYYVLHELDGGRGSVTLNTLNLGNAATNTVCDLGSGHTYNSLFIR